MNTFTLAGKSLDAKNNPAYAGRYMVFRITSVGADVEDGASYPRESVDVLIATDGTWTVDLWVNGDSGVECLYEVLEPSGQRIEFIFPSSVEATTVRYEFAIENYLASASAAQQTPGLAAHIADTNNPHQVDADDVGLGATDDVTFNAVSTGIVTASSVSTTVLSATTANVSSGLTLDTDLAITEGGTGASTASAALVNLGVQTASGGGNIGTTAFAVFGGAIGYDASATHGCAVGWSAAATTGGAIGSSASATSGFAGGESALANGVARVQLGTGTNSTDSTIQFLSSGSVTAIEFGTLAGTTASYTTAEETKLAGIEALADVTDATNVAAAGGYVAGGTDVAIADGGTGASTASAALVNLGVQTASGGAQVGNGASSSAGGAAVGWSASATGNGGAVGAGASVASGGAIGAIASSTTGGAVGEGATSTTGFAGGESASANGPGRVQLGTGTNATDSTIQFLSSGSVTASEFGRLAGTSGSLYSEANIISATATLDFPSIAPNAVSVLTMTVTGAAVGDTVMLGAPSTIEADLTWAGFVSAANTVSIRLHHTSGGAINPASATWRATVVKY